MIHIVKRKGHKEEYDPRKVYASVYSACVVVHMHHGEAELLAEKVSKEADQWVSTKTEVSSTEIFRFVSNTLDQYNPDAAFMYKTHRDIS